MHSIRSLLSVTCAIIGFALLAPPASQAAAPTFTTFTLDKVCSAATGFTNMVPSSCNITGFEHRCAYRRQSHLLRTDDQSHVRQQHGRPQCWYRQHRVGLLHGLSDGSAARRNVRVPRGNRFASRVPGRCEGHRRRGGFSLGRRGNPAPYKLSADALRRIDLPTLGEVGLSSI